MQSGVVINRAHTRGSWRRNRSWGCTGGAEGLGAAQDHDFVLQATGGDPDYTQAFLQACMEEYIALKKEMRTQTSDTTVAGLTEEVMRLEKELRKAEEEMVEFQSTNSVVLFQDRATAPAITWRRSTSGWRR